MSIKYGSIKYGNVSKSSLCDLLFKLAKSENLSATLRADCIKMIIYLKGYVGPPIKAFSKPKEVEPIGEIEPVEEHDLLGLLKK